TLPLITESIGTLMPLTSTFRLSCPERLGPVLKTPLPLPFTPGPEILKSASTLPERALFEAAATIRSPETGFGPPCLLLPPPQPARARAAAQAVAAATPSVRSG